MAYTLVIDQGTHASRALLFDSQGQLLEQQQQDIRLNRLDHRHLEQDADEILQSVRRVLARLDPQRLRQAQCCAISTQRSTVVAWHKQSGRPLYPAISWQDRRGDQALEKLAQHKASISRISGLPLSAHYGASKMHWLLQHVDAVQQAQQDDQLCIGPLASFLLHQLLGHQPYAIDHSNAHRTQLFDIRRLDWSNELTRLFQVPQALLPACRPLLHDYGPLADYPIPVTAVCGDQTAAFYANGQMETGAALINMGTGAFILSPI
ncbi:MAG TPA: FGGY family carbohydrate kinase, partial [Pseudomonadales bacterium]